MDPSSLVFLCFLTLSMCVLYQICHGQTAYNQYPSAMNGPYQSTYQAQSYEGRCNDIKCGASECCIETYRTPVCVPLVTSTATESNGQAFCARLKKCSSAASCPTRIIPVPPAGNPPVVQPPAARPFCCVQAVEPSFSATCPLNDNYYSSNSGNGIGYGNSYSNSYSNGYSNSYSNSYNTGYSNTYMSEYFNPLNFKEGYCRPAALPGQPCYKILPGSEAANCPCSVAGNACVIAGATAAVAATANTPAIPAAPVVLIPGPFVAGICGPTVPPGKKR